MSGIEPTFVLFAFLGGLLSFLSPCVLPLFPSYLSFVTGMSVTDLTGDLTSAAAASTSARTATGATP